MQRKKFPFPPHVYDHPAFLSLSLQQAAKALLIGGTTLLVVSVLLLLALRRRAWLFALVLLGVVEVLVFARNSLGGFNLETVESADFRRFVKENRSDNRIHYVDNANNAMSSGIYDIWGYDPGVMLRYARFMAFSQGFSPDRADVYTPITRASPLLRLLRCQYFLKDQGEKLNVTRLPGEPLQRFQLIRTYKIEPQRDRMLAALTHPEFDLAHEIILETEPDPQPQPDGEIEPGDIRILDSSTDHFTMEANLSAPAILLITDSFSKHWKARPLINGTQTSYEVMPANYCLQAIPLAAGKHHFRVEYLPAGFVVGKWISIISTMAFFGAVVWVVRRKGCRSREAGSACAPAE